MIYLIGNVCVPVFPQPLLLIHELVKAREIQYAESEEYASKEWKPLKTHAKPNQPRNVSETLAGIQPKQDQPAPFTGSDIEKTPKLGQLKGRPLGIAVFTVLSFS